MMNNLEVVAKKLKKNKRYWIAFVGDSITSTEWVHPNWREMVEYVLKDKFNCDWGIKTFNMAYDGSTSRDLAEKFNNLEFKNLIKQMDLVILLTGANDPFQTITVEEFEKNVSKMKKLIEERGVDFILSSDICPADLWAEEKCVPYVEKLKTVDPDFINLFEESKRFPKEQIYTFISETDIPEERVVKGEIDFWHPNQLGNAYIAKIILGKVFGMVFDPERYIETTKLGFKLPEY